MEIIDHYKELAFGRRCCKMCIGLSLIFMVVVYYIVPWLILTFEWYCPNMITIIKWVCEKYLFPILFISSIRNCMDLNLTITQHYYIILYHIWTINSTCLLRWHVPTHALCMAGIRARVPLMYCAWQVSMPGSDSCMVHGRYQRQSQTQLLCMTGIRTRVLWLEHNTIGKKQQSIYSIINVSPCSAGYVNNAMVITECVRVLSEFQ